MLVDVEALDGAGIFVEEDGLEEWGATRGEQIALSSKNVDEKIKNLKIIPFM
jgi:hypothetical protein